MEQLKLVLEAIKTLGAEGKEAFIWWLIATYVMYPAIMFAGFISLIHSLRYTIRFLIVENKKANGQAQ